MEWNATEAGRPARREEDHAALDPSSSSRPSTSGRRPSPGAEAGRGSEAPVHPPTLPRPCHRRCSLVTEARTSWPSGRRAGKKARRPARADCGGAHAGRRRRRRAGGARGRRARAGACLRRSSPSSGSARPDLGTQVGWWPSAAIRLGTDARLGPLGQDATTASSAPRTTTAR